MISVIIPCRNEASVLDQCLASLASQSGLPLGHEVEIILAANDCSDGTCEIARRHTPRLERVGYSVRLLNLREPGKARAMNAADAAARFQPRLYLDADVVLGHHLIAELLPLLCGPAPVYCSGQLRLPQAHSRTSRAYGRVWSRLPFVAEDVPGMGLYGVSPAGRRRWGAFPEIHSDDRFVRLMFARRERRKVAAPYEWSLPEGFWNLLKVRRRWNEGNDELAELFPSILARDTARNTLGAALPVLLRQPISSVVFLIVFSLAKLLAASRPSGTPVIWRRGRP